MVEEQFEELKRTIESAHINFLIGSGASMPFLETLGDLEKNITYINQQVADKKKLKLLEASIYKEYLEKCLIGNLLCNVQNIEEYKSHCKERKRGKCDEFIEVRKTYNSFIDTLNQLISLKDLELISKQINVFTTNVDVFLEEALERNKAVFNDGFSGRRKVLFDTANFHNSIFKRSSHYEYTSEQPLFNLFKIHGSLNWQKGAERNENEYEVLLDANLENLEKIDELISGKSDLFESYEVISDYCQSGNQKYIKSLEVGDDKMKIIKRFLVLYSKIVMVNPTKKKFEDTTRNLHYYEMLRLYSNHLERENSVLFVLGFSFSDEHILRITQRVAKSNPTLTIYILCSKESEDGFDSKFDFFNNVKCLSVNEGFYSLDKLNKNLKGILKSIPEAKKK